MNKTMGYISAGLKTMICVALFLICQMSALFLFIALGIDYKVYEGSFIALYSTLIIVLFSIYSIISSRKSERLIMSEKIEGKHVLVLLIIGFGLLGVVSVYMVFAQLIAEVLTPIQSELDKYSESVDRFSDITVDSVPWWDPLLDAFASSFIIPFAEELVFRGAIFGELSRKFNWIFSAFVSALIFGLFHGISIHIGYALISGFILCLVYRFTKSILASYIVHATFNLLGSSIYTLIDAGILSVFDNYRNILNLILFGLEIIAILPAAIGLYYLYLGYKKKLNVTKVV